MFSPRVARQGLRKASLRRGITTAADVEQAQKYCLNQLRSVSPSEMSPFPIAPS